MKYYHYYESSIGKLVIVHNDRGITNLYLAHLLQIENAIQEETDLIKEAVKQLDEYFNGLRQSFDLPLAPAGTHFQQKVWQALRNIPCGKTYSYKQIAEQIDNPKASRAIGMANNKNPILLLIPCHRVIGGNGKLVGFAAGLEVTKHLLTLEGTSYEC